MDGGQQPSLSFVYDKLYQCDEEASTSPQLEMDVDEDEQLLMI